MEVVCHKRCDDMLPCGHRCAKRCHHWNPTEHDPCRIPMEKIIKECGHTITCRCAQTPTVHDCQVPILKRLICDHVVQLACNIASSEEKLQRFSCTTPCNVILACEHKCQGTCSQCRSNRLHIPCQEKCTRVFICSHVSLFDTNGFDSENWILIQVCKAPCSANCPPCMRDCQTFCVHSKCPKRCSEPCVPCKEASNIL